MKNLEEKRERLLDMYRDADVKDKRKIIAQIYRIDEELGSLNEVKNDLGGCMNGF